MTENLNLLQPDSIEAMAEFCRNAARMLHQLTAPLEILNHLLYLANNDKDPAKVRQYLADAQAQALIVARGHLELLNACPGSKPEAA